MKFVACLYQMIFLENENILEIFFSKKEKF